MTSGSPRAARWRVVRSILVVATISWIAWVVATCEGDAPPPSDVDTASEASPSSRPGPILKGSPPAGVLLEPSAIPTTSPSTQGPARGPVRVVVRKPGTSSVALVVQLDGQPAQNEVWTSVEGKAKLDDLPYDGSATVVVAAPRPRSGALVSGVVRGPELLLETAEAPISCDIRAVDVESGGDVPGAKLLDRWSSGSLPGSQRLITWERNQVLRPFVHEPAGWTHQPVHDLAYWLSLRATRVRIAVPMSREADVVVEAGEGGTRGYGDLRIVSTQFADGLRGWPRTELRKEQAGPDRVRIHGIPWLPGEPLRVLAAAGPPRDAEAPEVDEVTEEPSGDERLWGDSTWPTPIEEDYLTDPGRFAIGMARLARTRADTTRLVATFGRLTPIGRTIETDNDLAYEESRGSFERTSHPRGEIEAIVFDRDGNRIPCARLLCEGVHRFTQADGTCRFADVLVGSRRIALVEPGWVRTGATVEVRDGEATKVELREGIGGRILLRVVDDLGHPLPAADIQAPSEAAWADLDADFVQRLDTRTDHRGECLLEAFPAGTWELWVLWASRSKRARVTVVEGETSEIQVTLPASADPTDAPK